MGSRDGSRFSGRFSVVLLMDVIEHMPKLLGAQLVSLMKVIGDRVAILTPDGFCHQYPAESRDAVARSKPWFDFESEHQRHISGWNESDFNLMGMDVEKTNVGLFASWSGVDK